MERLLLRLVATAAALFIAVQLVNGVDMRGLDLAGGVSTTQAVLNLGLIAVIFGVVNTVIRPLLKASTCLINILTLGLFTFVINAAMLYLTSIIGRQLNLGFEVTSVLGALEAAVIVSVMSVIFGFLIPDKK